MSIQDEIKFVKEELNNEEKFFEKVLSLERFFKKYKKFIIGFVAIAFLFLFYSLLSSYIKEKNTVKANQAYENLVKDPSNKNALAKLKESDKNFYDLYILNIAILNSDLKTLKYLTKSKAIGVADIAKYQLALAEGKEKELVDYAYDSNFILRDMAIIVQAVNFIKEGKDLEAKNLINLVNKNSLIYPYIQLLSHYGVSKK